VLGIEVDPVEAEALFKSSDHSSTRFPLASSTRAASIRAFLNPPMTVASCPVASASAAKGKTLRQGYRRIRCGKQYGH
jgi:hypothetical protein